MEPTFQKSVKARWVGGEQTIGGWISSPGAVTAEVMARAGFDYVCIDGQHGLIDFGDIASLLQVLALGDSVPLVRVARNEPGTIGQVLDAGALGVVVPMVNSAAEAQAAVAASLYAPEGVRSFGPNGVGMRVPGYYGAANETVMCIPMIETAAALEAVDDILSVPGVDVIYIGPADLSISLGLPPGNNDAEPIFVEALETVVAACKRHGVVPGIHATPDLVARRQGMGFQMVTAVSDLGALRSGIAAAMTSASGQVESADSTGY